MHDLERRRAPRIRDHHSIAYALYNEQDEVEEQGLARTLNVSVRGSLIETISPLAVGSWLTLMLQWGDRLLSLESQVMHGEPAPSGLYQVGLALQGAPAALLSRATTPSAGPRGPGDGTNGCSGRRHLATAAG